MKLTIVMGATASGKTHFIQDKFSTQTEVDILNVYDYQQRAYDEAGCKEFISFDERIRCLYAANSKLLENIIEKLLSGRDVVVEQTFYKAKRRIAYIDEIRKQVADVEIEVYVMSPGLHKWKSNLQKRNLENQFKHHKSSLEEIEFPNIAEGMDRIYEVLDEKVILRDDPAKPEILETARKELQDEVKRLCEENDAKNKRRELLESMKIRPFWHYCEVCGKKEFIDAATAFNNGWDYPPNIGAFGMLGPRTCGECALKDTLYWKINTNDSLPIVIEKNLSPEELKTWRRIKKEPESLLCEEE
ncbi:MAG: AAA family ATPase [Lachnospiraceae bacterium]|nr:AAA family ATPase [Lachnospiraceae bacterium]